MRRCLLAVVACLVPFAGACGGSTRAADPPTSSSTTGAAAPSTTRAAPTSPPTTGTTTTVAATTAPTSARTVPPTTPAPATGQLVVASAPSYGSSYATFTAYEQRGGRWVPRFGPWTARIGRNGFAPAGAKREGDGRTPSGTYGFSFFFGIATNPGVRFEYRRITSHALVWDDDPASPNYNEWIDTRVSGAGTRPEPMYNAPVYDYGAVIAYNPARTPGLGSAIFLHVSDGTSTAGCVALPVARLLDVLRWLDPALHPQVRMGVGAVAPA